MRYEGMVNKKHVFKVIFTFLLMMTILITSSITVRSEENILKFQPKEGFVKVEGVPEYTDEEFNSKFIRITIFTASWCTYCKELKEKFPDFIYSKFSGNYMAVRVWDIDSPQVSEYFEKLADKNNIQSEFIGQIPFIFINEQYPYLGYSEEIANNVAEDIEAIFSEMEPPHGGNLDEEESHNEDIFNEDIKNSIGNQGSKLSFMKSGLLDNFKFIFMLLFSIIYLFALSISRNNKYLLFLTYFIGIFAFNVLTLVFKNEFLLQNRYVQGLKITLYIATAIILCEFIVAAITEGIENSKNKLIAICIKILHSKFMYFIAFLLGFLVMNSQVNINNTNYISILSSISGKNVTAKVITNVLVYSLSLVLVSVIVALCIRAVKSFIMKNDKIKAGM